MSNDIYISSNLEIDIENIEKLFNKKIKKKFNTFNMKSNEIYIPPQTINTGGIFTINDRYNEIIKLSEIDNENPIILIIHNSLKTSTYKIIDYISIILYYDKQKYTINGEELEINFTILEKYPKFKNVIDDLIYSYVNSNKNYIYDGCENKLSEIIDKYYNLSNNWTYDIFNVSNKTRVNNLLTTLISKNIN